MFNLIYQKLIKDKDYFKIIENISKLAIIINLICD